MTDFIEDFCELMKDERLQKFRNKYVKDYSDIETIIMWACLYEKISKEYFNRYQQTISNDTVRQMFRYLFTNKQFRKKIISSFRKFQNENLPMIPFSEFKTIQK